MSDKTKWIIFLILLPIYSIGCIWLFMYSWNTFIIEVITQLPVLNLRTAILLFTGIYGIRYIFSYKLESPKKERIYKTQEHLTQVLSIYFVIFILWIVELFLL